MTGCRPSLLMIHGAYKTPIVLAPKPLPAVGTTTDPDRRVPTSYLYATGDTAVPVGHIPHFDGEQPVGSHEVMFTDPKLLAAKIIEAARD